MPECRHAVRRRVLFDLGRSAAVVTIIIMKIKKPKSVEECTMWGLGIRVYVTGGIIPVNRSIAGVITSYRNYCITVIRLRDDRK